MLEVNEKDNEIINNAHISVDLTGVKTLDELSDRVSHHAYVREGCMSYYTCLFKNWDLPGENGERLGLDNGQVTMTAGVKDGQKLDNTSFDRKYLLPPKYLDESPQCFVFNMLHHQDRIFGYTAIGFFEPKAYKASYQGWLINISNALENIRIHSEMNHLVYKLEDLYVKDVLTGIYNRRGLSLASKYLKQCVSMNVNIMIFSADIDNLKQINDNFGHLSGDKAIKLVASALTYASRDDEISIRMGGDEFTAIGMEYDENKLEKFIKDFKDYISSVNKSDRHQFQVRVSYGYYMITPNTDTTLEECINIADARMYIQKSRKKQRNK